MMNNSPEYYESEFTPAELEARSKYRNAYWLAAMGEVKSQRDSARVWAMQLEEELNVVTEALQVAEARGEKLAEMYGHMMSICECGWITAAGCECGCRE